MSRITRKRTSLFESCIEPPSPGTAGDSTVTYEDIPAYSDTPIHAKRKISYENSYRMEPDKKFPVKKVQKIMNKILTFNIGEKKYDPIECAILCKSLCGEIKKKVFDLHLNRYKIVAVVTIGQKDNHNVLVGSCFLWDHSKDTFAETVFENRTLYCVAVVYAVYYE